MYLPSGVSSDRWVSALWIAVPEKLGAACFSAANSDEASGRALVPENPFTFRYSGSELRCQGQVMTVLVPMTVEQDEDGWWCAHAQLGPNVGANGQGRTRKEALDDLREAVLASFEADGQPSAREAP